jgi:hypothetical protein
MRRSHKVDRIIGTHTSDGKPKPAKAERGTVAGRGRRVLMTTVCPLRTRSQQMQQRPRVSSADAFVGGQADRELFPRSRKWSTSVWVAPPVSARTRIGWVRAAQGSWASAGRPPRCSRGGIGAGVARARDSAHGLSGAITVIQEGHQRGAAIPVLVGAGRPRFGGVGARSVPSTSTTSRSASGSRAGLPGPRPRRTAGRLGFGPPPIGERHGGSVG